MPYYQQVPYFDNHPNQKVEISWPADRRYYGHPDSKVHVANLGPTWALSAPGGPPVGPINLAIRVVKVSVLWQDHLLL